MGRGKGLQAEEGGRRQLRPHLVMFPFPALGHIRPMMQLAQYVARRGGALVTFVNTEHNHQLILKASASSSSTSSPSSSSSASDQEGAAGGGTVTPPHQSFITMASSLPEHDGLPIRLAALPDGLAPGEDRTADIVKLFRSMNSMEPLLLRFLQQLQPPATCLVSDHLVNLNIPAIAAELRIAISSFWCPSIALARLFCDLELLQVNEDVTPDGIPINPSEYLKTSQPGVPRIRNTELPWMLAKDEEGVTFFYLGLMKRFRQMCMAPWILCNSSIELEREVVESFPEDVNIFPVGPLFSYDFEGMQPNGQSNEEYGTPNISTDKATSNGTSVGFWMEEHECLRWLDGRDAASVVYVSFGSLAMFNQAQLQELASGLEASKQAFLWVVRADLMDGTTARLPEGFDERTRGRGLVIGWAPQLAVLAHRAVGCFMTHCGWNSTMEAVCNGVPMIAWPYFADQFMDREYLVEKWRVGKAVQVVHINNGEEDGCNYSLVRRGCIEEAIRDVMQCKEMRRRVQELGARIRASVHPGGSSKSKLDAFIADMWRTAGTIHVARRAVED